MGTEGEQVEIVNLSHKDLVDRLSAETDKASDAGKLSYLFAEASIAEANNRLTIEEGRSFYGKLALAASNVAQKNIDDSTGKLVNEVHKLNYISANMAVSVSLAASERVVRGLEQK